VERQLARRRAGRRLKRFVGLCAAGRYALFEDDNVDEPRPRDYNLDLKTGALARLAARSCRPRGGDP
jgi:hypothetical protein